MNLENLKYKKAKLFTNEEKQFLKEKWIINWVWWNNLPKLFRIILTKLFFYLDFEIHDINYWQLEFRKNKKEFRKNADFWLLKYSWISPLSIFKNFKFWENIFLNIFIFIFSFIKFIILLFPLIISPFVYFIVRFFWKSYEK
jgi:hypothetical protein